MQYLNMDPLAEQKRKPSETSAMLPRKFRIPNREGRFTHFLFAEVDKHNLRIPRNDLDSHIPRPVHPLRNNDS